MKKIKKILIDDPKTGEKIGLHLPCLNNNKELEYSAVYDVKKDKNAICVDGLIGILNETDKVIDICKNDEERVKKSSLELTEDMFKDLVNYKNELSQIGKEALKNLMSNKENIVLYEFQEYYVPMFKQFINNDELAGKLEPTLKYILKSKLKEDEQAIIAIENLIQTVGIEKISIGRDEELNQHVTNIDTILKYL